MSGPVSIELTIKNIVFQAAEGTFSVFRGENPEVGTVSVVYKGQAPFAGEQVRLSGSWGDHPRFGRQFQARSWEAVQPKGTEGLVKMLGSGVLKGVGPAMAQRIVDKFGEETLEILEKSPERLREVSGIGKRRPKPSSPPMGNSEKTGNWCFSWKAMESAAALRPGSRHCTEIQR